MADERDPFARRLAFIAIGALVVRLAYVVLIRPHHGLPAPDAFGYHHGSNLLAQGHWFVDPYAFLHSDVVEPAADRPPAYLLYLSLFSVIGLSSPLWHMVASTLLGSAAVVMVGLVGREVDGARTGLVAAAMAAVYSELVIADGSLQAESMAVLAVTTLAYVALRYRRGPTTTLAVGMGGAVGWAGMARSEQFLLGIVVVAPVVLRAHRDLRARLVALAVAGAVAISFALPWIAFNATRFNQTVLLSNNLDYTIATTNCSRTWSGERIGFWDNACNDAALAAASMSLETGDQSDRAAVYRRAGFDHARANWSRLPAVVSARLLRSLSLWNPVQTIELERRVEGREPVLGAMSMVSFYFVVVLAAIGARSLKRRGLPMAELVGPVVVVFLMAALFMGNARYRTPAAGGACVLAAVGSEALMRSRRGRSEDAIDREDRSGAEPSVVATG